MKYAALLVLGLAFQDTRVKGENPIDAFLEAKWKELKITPNKRAGDEEFLRRVTLDLIGTIPDPSEIEAFLSSRNRENKIDELLASDEWADYWSRRLATIMVTPDRRRLQAIQSLQEHLEDRLGKATPYDKIVEELVTAKGNIEDKSTAFVFAYLYKDKTQKKDVAVQISKVFMGIQLQCAQCHDHPFERWTKDDFFSVVANFASTSVKGNVKKDQAEEVSVVESPGRKGYRPEGYKVEVKPKFIDGEPIAGQNKRSEFARRLVSRDNLQFAKATVNRIWSIFMGQGFVEPVDDFSVRNQPLLPELLETLAKGFIESGYDLKALMNVITTSRAYQLSSKRDPKQFSDEAKKYYAYAIVRPMSPDQLFGALFQAQGVDETFGKRRDARRQFFRDASMAQMSDSPGEYNANIQQIMKMLNMDSPLYAGAKADRRSNGRLAQILKKTRKPEDVFEHLYLATVSRKPTADELAHCMSYFKEHGSSTSAYEDIFFVLLNTNEFFFNH
jgi:hypothetical protein